MDENEYFSGVTLENHEKKIIKELSQLQIIFDWKYIEQMHPSYENVESKFCFPSNIKS